VRINWFEFSHFHLQFKSLGAAKARKDAIIKIKEANKEKIPGGDDQGWTEEATSYPTAVPIKSQVKIQAQKVETPAFDLDSFTNMYGGTTAASTKAPAAKPAAKPYPNQFDNPQFQDYGSHNQHSFTNKSAEDVSQGNFNPVQNQPPVDEKVLRARQGLQNAIAEVQQQLKQATTQTSTVTSPQMVPILINQSKILKSVKAEFWQATTILNLEDYQVVPVQTQDKVQFAKSFLLKEIQGLEGLLRSVSDQIAHITALPNLLKLIQIMVSVKNIMKTFSQ